MDVKSMSGIEKLLYIIENMKRLESDITLFSSREFKTFYHAMKHDMYDKALLFLPTTPARFLKLLEHPLEAWGYFSKEEITSLEEDGVPSDLRIIDGDNGLNEEIEEVLLAKESLREQRSGAVAKAIEYIRQKIKVKNTDCDWQQQYIDFRHFLTMNPVMNTIKRNRLIEHFDAKLQSFLISCYESIPSQAKYICPYCGWTVMQTEKLKLKCIKLACKAHFNLATLESIPRKCDIRLKDTIQLTTVIPTIIEFEFNDMLLKLPEKPSVFWYPEVERKGDLLVQSSTSSYYIDIKDYKSSDRLARELITKKNTITSPYIVISDTRNQGNHYVRHANQTLREAGITRFSVYSFSQMVDTIRKESEVYA